MYYDRPRRRSSSPRRILILLALIAAGLYMIANQNQLRQVLIPQPTPTATRTARSYVVEAQSLVEAGRLKESIDAYIQAISLDPNNVDVLIAMSRLMALSGRTEEAVRRAERAAQLAPQRAEAQAALAMALDWYAAWLELHGRDTEAQRNYQKAIDTAKTAISLNPNYPEAYAYLAETYADINDWNDATDAVQKAVDLNPDRADVQRALGYVRESQGSYTGAAEAYEKAIKLEPNLAYLYVVLGRNYRVIAGSRDGSVYPKALDAFNKAIVIDPNYVTAYDELGWTYYNLAKLADAQPTLEKAIAVHHSHCPSQYHVAQVYCGCRRYYYVSVAFTQPIDLMNQDFDAEHYCVTSTSRTCDRFVAAYNLMGLTYYFLKQCETDAYPAFRRALVLRPGELTALRGIQLCDEALGTPVPKTPTPKP